MTSGTMRNLREAPADLDEATVRLVEHTVDHRELAVVRCWQNQCSRWTSRVRRGHCRGGLTPGRGRHMPGLSRRVSRRQNAVPDGLGLSWHTASLLAAGRSPLFPQCQTL